VEIAMGIFTYVPITFIEKPWQQGCRVFCREGGKYSKK